MLRRSGFSLIELLVVIAVISIIAAILFPVFAKVREKARQTACLSNMNQIGKATIEYTQDYDEMLYPHRWDCSAACNPLIPQMPAAAQADVATHKSGKKIFWPVILQPYLQSWKVFECPSNPNAWSIYNPDLKDCDRSDACDGVAFGAENSYGHNDGWLSPVVNVGATNSSKVKLVALNDIDTPASTVEITDATYCSVGPDYMGQSGVTPNYNGQTGTTLTGDQNFVGTGAAFEGQGTQYQGYWGNIGNGHYCWVATDGSGEARGVGGGSAATIDYKSPDYNTGGPGRHNGFIDCQFVDGHVKAIRYQTLVSNMCLWVTNVQGSSDGTHKNPDHTQECGG